MVSRNTTLVPSQRWRIGPACEAGLSAGMRRERVPPQMIKIKISAPRWPITLSDCYKIWHGRASLSSSPSRKISSSWLWKCGLRAPEIAKIGNFWYKFSPKGYTLLNDLYKIRYWEGVPALHPLAKFQRCGFKNVGIDPWNRQNW